MTTPDGQTINYSYDAAGRLSQIIPNSGQPFSFTYDAGGRRTALAYPNGVTAGYTYDTQNNLTGLVYNTSASATIDSFTYTYDNARNRLTKADINYQYGYTYDADYEVTQCLATQVAQSPTFQLYTEAFTYDDTGNRLTGPGYSKPAGYAQNYFYDYEHRLVKVVNQLGSNVDTITFKYDPFGRRIEKNVETVENNFPTTYNYVYVYDNDDIFLEILNKTQNGTTMTITTSYVHGPGIDEHLSLRRDGQTYYYHADGLGSITSVTDATQAVVNRYAYDTYGAMKRSETVWNDFGFAGREYDSETGLYYLRARYYDPETGKFIGKDPIGFAGGDVNLYRYVLGNPVRYIDPFGLDATQDLLVNTATLFWFATGLAALTPVTAPAVPVLGAIAVSATAAEIYRDSKHPLIDATGESAKMIIGVKLDVPLPYSIFTDKMIDEEVNAPLDALKQHLDEKQAFCPVRKK
jgi:RHS repeat-associated protein